MTIINTDLVVNGKIKNNTDGLSMYYELYEKEIGFSVSEKDIFLIDNTLYIANENFIYTGDINDFESKIEQLGSDSGTGFVSFETISSNTQLEANKGYIVEHNELNPIELLLPNDIQLGDKLEIINKGGGFKITQNSEDRIEYMNIKSRIGTDGSVEITQINESLNISYIGTKDTVLGLATQTNYKEDPFNKKYSQYYRNSTSFGNFIFTFPTNVNISETKYKPIYIEKIGINQNSTFEKRDFTFDIGIIGKRVYDAKISMDGKFLALTTNDTTDKLMIYEIDYDNYTFTKLSGAVDIQLPGVAPGFDNYINQLNFDKQGDYLSVQTGSSSPYLYIYKIDSFLKTFTKLANPDILIDSIISSSGFSPNGQIFVATCSSSGKTLQVYTIDRNTDTFTKVTSELPSVEGGGNISFSPNGQYIQIPQDSKSDYVYEINYTDNTFTSMNFDKSGAPASGSQSYLHNYKSTCFPDNETLLVTGATTLYGNTIYLKEFKLISGQWIYNKTLESYTRNSYSYIYQLGINLFNEILTINSVDGMMIYYYNNGNYTQVNDFANMKNPNLHSDSYEIIQSADGKYFVNSFGTRDDFMLYKYDSITKTIKRQYTLTEELSREPENVIAFSPDNKYFVCRNSASLNVYLIENGTINDSSKMSLSTGSDYPNNINFSPNGQYLNVGVGSNNGYMLTYEVDSTNNTFTQINIGMIPTLSSGINKMKYSPNGQYLMILSGYVLNIYKVDYTNNTFTLLDNLTNGLVNLPTTSSLPRIEDFNISQDGVKLLIKNTTSIMVFNIDYTTDIFTEIINDTTSPIGNVISKCQFSPTGEIILNTFHENISDSYVKSFTINPDNTLSENIIIDLPTYIRGVIFTKDNQYMLILNKDGYSMYKGNELSNVKTYMIQNDIYSNPQFKS